MSKTRASKTTGKKEEPRSRAISDSGSSSTASMKTSEIRDLIDFISKSGLNEVNIETNELKLSVKRDPDQKVFKSTQAAPIQAVIPANTLVPISNAELLAAKPELPSSGTISGKKTAEIRSPMIGTFYRSANPDSSVFVSVGDKITKGQTVCIIEAMKLFNEIESEVSGTIVKIMIENSTPVEYDQVLFIVEPD